MSISTLEEEEDSQLVVTSDEGVFTTNLDTVALDFDIMSVLKNRKLKGDHKWLQYYSALERYLYKKDPTFKAPQFKFDVHEDSTGNLTINLRQESQSYSKYVKYLPTIIGPVIGAVFSSLLR